MGWGWGLVEWRCEDVDREEETCLLPTLRMPTRTYLGNAGPEDKVFPTLQERRRKLTSPAKETPTSCIYKTYASYKPVPAIGSGYWPSSRPARTSLYAAFSSSDGAAAPRSSASTLSPMSSTAVSAKGAGAGSRDRATFSASRSATTVNKSSVDNCLALFVKRLRLRRAFFTAVANRFVSSRAIF